MPYLHWATGTRRRLSLAPPPPPERRIEHPLPTAATSSAGGVKISTLSGLVKNLGATHTKLHLKWQPYFLKARTPLGQLLLSAAGLYEAMSCFNDQRIQERYLKKNPPLHPRRSLNQYSLWSSCKDDADQVVFNVSHSPAALPPLYDRGIGESKLLIVDQLWLWILDGSRFPYFLHYAFGISGQLSRAIQVMLYSYPC
jgi:hypothetical protein